MQSKVKTAIALASAAGALFALSAPLTTAHADDMSVKCAGVNSCKGQSECKSAQNECKNMNTCKGHGWVTKASAKECKAAGGTVIQ